MNAHLFKLIVFACVMRASWLEFMSPRIILHPKNATVMEGETVTLHCELKHPVENCKWVHNEINVKMGQRYHYSNTKANGRNTSNCSLVIRPFDKSDVSKWECFSIHNVYSESTTAYLMLADPPIISTDNSSKDSTSACYDQAAFGDFNYSIILSYCFSSILVFIILVGAILYCIRRRSKEGKKNAESCLKTITPETLHLSSGQEMHEYSYIIDYELPISCGRNAIID